MEFGSSPLALLPLVSHFRGALLDALTTSPVYLATVVKHDIQDSNRTTRGTIVMNKVEGAK